MAKINSLPEANEAIARIAETIQELQDFMVRFGAMFAGFPTGTTTVSSSSRSHRTEGGRDHERHAHEEPVVPGIPKTIIGRILSIFREASEPLTRKEVTDIYQSHGWPLPEKGTLYAVVAGTISYLSTRKKTLRSVEGGYVLVGTTAADRYPPISAQKSK